MTGLSVVNSASKSRSDKPCGCSSLRLKSHQVDDVDDPDFEFWNCRAKQIDRGQGLEGRNVAGAGHHDVRLGAAVVARPFPDADPGVQC